MAFLGLSGDTLTFLGGVAEGTSKTLSRQIAAQQEAIKEASSTMIRARLAGRKKYDSDVEEMTKEIKPLLSQYNLPNVAALMALPTAQRTKIVSQLAAIDGKDDRGKFFKAIKEFDGKTDLTESELINSLIPAYKESKMDYSNLIPKTFSDVLFGFDPADKLTTRVKAGAGDIRADVSRTDLTPYEQGLNRQGKIKVLSEDAKDVNNFKKTLAKSLFIRVGGKGVDTIGGGYRADSGMETDLELATSYAELVSGSYNAIVKKYQIDEGLSLIEAQNKARKVVFDNVNSQYNIDDPAGNITKLRGLMDQKALSNTTNFSGFMPLLKGNASEKLAVNSVLFYSVDRFKNKAANNQSIGPAFFTEVVGDIRESLIQSGYNQDEIKTIIAQFSKEIKKYTTSQVN